MRLCSFVVLQASVAITSIGHESEFLSSRSSVSAQKKHNGEGTPDLLLIDPLQMFLDPGRLVGRIEEKTGQHTMVEVRSDRWVPTAHVSTSDDKIVVSVELPGIEWMDARAEVIGDKLVVQGEKRHDIPSDVIPRSIRANERKFGHFYREFQLPENADVAHATAELNRGILRVTIPLTQEGESRRIRIWPPDEAPTNPTDESSTE
jgi:HSP20 family protein